MDKLIIQSMKLSASWGDILPPNKILKNFSLPRFELEVSNQVVPCYPEFEFNIYAFGFNKLSASSVWTPPSCIVTTPAPTTTTPAPSVSAGTEATTESMMDKMEEVQAENDRLNAKIDGLKQEYEKIGLQVFLSFQDHFFAGLEDFMARRRAGSSGVADTGNSTDPMFAWCKCSAVGTGGAHGPYRFFQIS